MLTGSNERGLRFHSSLPGLLPVTDEAIAKGEFPCAVKHYRLTISGMCLIFRENVKAMDVPFHFLTICDFQHFVQTSIVTYLS